jgi:hypothetical protein
MNQKQLQQIREVLQQVVTAQGRDDIAVGDVSEADGKIRFTLTRGRFTHTDEVPIEVFKDAATARDRLTPAIFRLSKQVEREHIEQATS